VWKGKARIKGATALTKETQKKKKKNNYGLSRMLQRELYRDNVLTLEGFSKASTKTAGGDQRGLGKQTT